MNNLSTGNKNTLIYGILGAGAAFMLYRYYQNKKHNDTRASSMTSHTGSTGIDSRNIHRNPSPSNEKK